MSFSFSKHELEELDERKIPQSLVEQVLQAPEQKVSELENIMCFQSQVEINGKLYLLRVMVNETVKPPKVVTAYHTGKINKYWRSP